MLVNQGTTCPQYPLHLRESGWYFWPLLGVNLGILRIEAQRNWRLNSNCRINAVVIPWETGIYCTIADLINCAACRSCRDPEFDTSSSAEKWWSGMSFLHLIAYLRISSMLVAVMVHNIDEKLYKVIVLHGRPLVVWCFVLSYWLQTANYTSTEEATASERLRTEWVINPFPWTMIVQL